MNGVDAAILTLAVNAAWQVPLVAAALLLALRAERRASGKARARLAAAALLLATALPWTAFARVTTTPAGGLPSRPAPSRESTTPAAPLAATIVPVPLSTQLVPVAAGLYLAFLVYRLLALAWAVRAAERLRHRSRRAPADVDALARDCAARLGLPSVDVRLSPDVRVPLTLGVRRPLVLLPERLIGAVPPDALRAALAHEAAHVRRHDVRWHLGLELLTAPIAFHPATAALKRLWHRSREEACDEDVVRHVVEPRAYAAALVEVARHALGGPAPAHALAAVDAHTLEDRIMRLLDGRPLSPRLRPVRAAAVLGLAALLGSALSLAVDGAGGLSALGPARVQASDGETAMELEPSGYAYTSTTRRDPFRDLRQTQPPVPCEGGLRCFHVSEVALRGIVRLREETVALLLAADRRTYFAHRGDRLHDGVITGIESGALTLTQDVTDPLAPARRRTVVLKLHD